MAATELT